MNPCLSQISCCSIHVFHCLLMRDHVATNQMKCANDCTSCRSSKLNFVAWIGHNFLKGQNISHLFGVHFVSVLLYEFSCHVWTTLCIVFPVPEKPKTWAALAASHTPSAQSSSAPATNSQPVRQAQQVGFWDCTLPPLTLTCSHQLTQDKNELPS